MKFLSSKKNKSIILGSFILLLLVFCKNEPTANQQDTTLPNTPETVSKQWQSHLDKNEIEKVARLSTQSTKVWLEENKEIFLSDKQIYRTQFMKMNCNIKEEEATCHFTIREDDELIEDYFLLKNVNGQWLVDLEEENSSPELEEQIFKEMERELNLNKSE